MQYVRRSDYPGDHGAKGESMRASWWYNRGVYAHSHAYMYAHAHAYAGAYTCIAHMHTPGLGPTIFDHFDSPK